MLLNKMDSQLVSLGLTLTTLTLTLTTLTLALTLTLSLTLTLTRATTGSRPTKRSPPVRAPPARRAACRRRTVAAHRWRRPPTIGCARRSSTPSARARASAATWRPRQACSPADGWAGETVSGAGLVRMRCDGACTKKTSNTRSRARTRLCESERGSEVCVCRAIASMPERSCWKGRPPQRGEVKKK